MNSNKYLWNYSDINQDLIVGCRHLQSIEAYEQISCEMWSKKC